MHLRVFIAIDVEDPLLVRELDKVKDLIVSTGVPMKPVESHNYHITLRFIGEVDRGLVDEIVETVLKPLDVWKFRIHFKGLDAFPGPYRPRVVWVGVDEGAEELTTLWSRIEKGLRRLGVKPDSKGFEPHLTIARVKGTRNLRALVRLIEQYSDYDFGWMKVESIRLKKSTLTRSGPIYETLYEVKTL
ncbi:MAG: RNA 2',3'-cyclic phosphodiesterase [Desulfurococcales archaeon]|nr:RNA 2',3'-cyclic phosphodiesterase [Desulfurococcales archaeon]